MQAGCANHEQFDQVFTCTKNKLYNDPTTTSNPGDMTEIVTYGDQLSSQVRLHLMTDAQAKDLFTQKLTQMQARHAPAPQSQGMN